MKYLLNMTFYAGSDDPEDTDNDLYLLETDIKMSYEEIREIIFKVNKECGSIDDEDVLNDYEVLGLNLNTLMNGVQHYLPGSKIELLDNNHGYLGDIDNYYAIEQWY
jgi:hypothetical protein